MSDDDWVQDSSLSSEETLRRFNALGPEPTVGPPATTVLRFDYCPECKALHRVAPVSNA